ncbi:hypothetical protein [Chryseobacterium indologenes]|uniref:hypothetical protein n=1 Tax=Chryseobacterium indologenes TaxID=253 RepID=UPI003015EF40
MFEISSNTEDLIPSLEFILKIIGGIGALTVFIIGLIQYTKEQTWKRNEFVAARAKEFNSDKMVQNTMYMLDWGKRYIELFPHEPDIEKRYAKVTREILKSALQSHKLKSNFTKTEVAIRDNFDCFLNYFEIFEQYTEAGLITSKELQPYLKYWIVTISEDIEDDVKNSIHHYINEYGYKETQNFFRRFGKNILPTTDLITTKFNVEGMDYDNTQTGS